MPEFERTEPLARDIHRGPGGIHGNRGGSYNEWWRVKVREAGGPGEVTPEHVRGWLEDLKKEGIVPPN